MAPVTNSPAQPFDAVAVIRTEADRMADVVAAADPGARCPTCPEWTVHDLLWHLTEVHLFWGGILARNARTDDDVQAVEQSKPARPETLGELLALRAEATAELAEQLTRLDDTEPRWTWWEADQTVGFTRRMQTHEATMHRIDAELAAGGRVGPIDTAVAEAAVDHCVDVMWGWLPEWGTYRSTATVAFEATDTGRRWVVDVGRWTGTGPESGNAFDQPRAVRAGDGAAEPSATVRARAEDLARWAWTRLGPGGDGAVAIEGDEAAVGAIRDLIDNGIQ